MVVTKTLVLNSKSFVFYLIWCHLFIQICSNCIVIELRKRYSVGRLQNQLLGGCPILYKHIPIMISKNTFLVNLIQFDLFEFDVIFRMDWLTTHRGNICCKELKVILKNQKGQEVCFYGERDGKQCPMISTMTARRILRQGCT